MMSKISGNFGITEIRVKLKGKNGAGFANTQI